MMTAYEEFLNLTGNDLNVAIELIKSSTICLLIQVAVYLPIVLVYQVIIPMFWEKQTIGRMAAGVRVMHLTENKKASLGSILVRELIGGFVFNILFVQTLVFPILNYVFSRNRGRSLSDMISKTRLVDYKLAQAQATLFGENFEEPKVKDDFINADYKEVYKEKEEDVETEYKVF